MFLAKTGSWYCWASFPFPFQLYALSLSMIVWWYIADAFLQIYRAWATVAGRSACSSLPAILPMGDDFVPYSWSVLSNIMFGHQVIVPLPRCSSRDVRLLELCASTSPRASPRFESLLFEIYQLTSAFREQYSWELSTFKDSEEIDATLDWKQDTN